MFFLFKQKTAYEMRISDWSSDVCSSDLPVSNAPARPQAECRHPGGLENQHQRSSSPPPRNGGRWVRNHRTAWRITSSSVDRKSVVKGKSVSVRVDLGGRRIIQKH